MNKLLLIILLFTGVNGYAQVGPQPKTQQETVASVMGLSPVKMDSVIYKYLENRGIPPFTRKLIVSHARTESGVYTNSLVLYHNNLFGMKHPRQRPTTSLGPKARAEGKNGYASFASIESCIEDYLLYLEYVKELKPYKSTAQYVGMLERHNYFGSNPQVYLRNMKYHNTKQSSL